MVSVRRTVNATVGSLLGFLHEGPQSGWDLVATAQRSIGDFWSLTRSQVYRELAGMAADGLVRAAAEPGPRDRRVYELTDAGRTVFREWIREVPGPEQIRYPLLLTLAFRRHLSDAQVRSFVLSHRRTHADRLAGYAAEHRAALAAGADVDQLLTLDFGIRYEQAVLDWFDALPAALGGGADQA
ncbi:MAG: PadR family transcriptional regulator [Mycobacteriales bacterium]